MIELEKTYLAKFLPDDLKKCDSKEVLDIYIPFNLEHPDLRIRKSGDEFEITRKRPIEDKDSSKQRETTIELSEDEFEDLALVQGKRIRKIRYYYNDYEIDVFCDGLEGLVLVDKEFKTEEEKEKFEMPEFCLADVTQEDFIAGGMLAGKNYKDIDRDLRRFNYQKLSL